MADLLIRGVPASVVRAIDTRAAHQRISRNEYLRRQLAENLTVSEESLTTASLSDFAETFSDLDDPSTMSQAWR